ncbi:17342_t:CDS:1 [Cetraspora pellucida]|uniref:17342_t:CDS:1 n=1 Tax=Cetraspora pellucida TaxID=1433469 RepID=A0A9N9BB22_9GLOM|nr:17342_t:CDS:1 [Cetraspora pellucida]
MSTKEENSAICIDECKELNQETLKDSDTTILSSSNQIINEQSSPQNIQIPLKTTTFSTCCSQGNSPTSAPCESAYFDVYGVSSISATSNCCIKSTTKQPDNN